MSPPTDHERIGRPAGIAAAGPADEEVRRDGGGTAAEALPAETRHAPGDAEQRSGGQAGQPARRPEQLAGAQDRQRRDSYQAEWAEEHRDEAQRDIRLARHRATAIDALWSGGSVNEQVAALMRLLTEIRTYSQIELFWTTQRPGDRTWKAGQLVEVLCQPEPVMYPITTPDHLRGMIARYAVDPDVTGEEDALAKPYADQAVVEPFADVREGQLVFREPEVAAMRALLSARTSPGVPLLRGIAPLPLFRLDGSTCTEEGYDSASQWYCVAQAAQVSPMHAAITAFARQHAPWRGDMTGLAAWLGCPGKERWLSGQLKQVASMLEAAGYAARKTGGTSGPTKRDEYEITTINALDAHLVIGHALTSGNEVSVDARGRSR